MERHPLDLVSLTAGLIFTAAAIVGLTGAISLGIDDLRWIGPALLVLFGVVLVATSVSRRDDRAADAPVTQGASTASAGGTSPTSPAGVASSASRAAPAASDDPPTAR